MWIMKEVKKRITAWHKHEEHWSEGYKDKEIVKCAECEESHPNASIVQIANGDVRPNQKVYWTVGENFRNPKIQVRPLPTADPAEWEARGHTHGKMVYWPVTIAGENVCPWCLEIAPPAISFSTIQMIEDPEKPFSIQVHPKEDPSASSSSQVMSLY